MFWIVTPPPNYEHASGKQKPFKKKNNNLSAGEYLNFNMEYERDATNCGLVVQAYHTNNGVFTYKQSTEVIKVKG